jgi:hypothetical protein
MNLQKNMTHSCTHKINKKDWSKLKRFDKISKKVENKHKAILIDKYKNQKVRSMKNKNMEC